MKLWSSEPLRKLFTIEDSPESIARGLATGILFGSAPLLGFKTLLSLLLAAWLSGNKIAAVVGASLHDLTVACNRSDARSGTGTVAAKESSRPDSS